MKPQFLIAAPASDSGKTTLTLGLLRLLADQGRRPQPFKCGPDYLDPVHHSLAARRPSVNLDTFMMSEAHVREVYARHMAGADIGVVEGMMGLFDGADRMEGSSASIAALLGLPVILIVNAQAMAYSAAPLLQGFSQFHRGVRVAGAIFNFVNSPGHFRYLSQACADVGVEALGYVPENDGLRLPSRHLGLAISPENDYEAVIRRISAHIGQTVDIRRLLEITSVQPVAEPPPARPASTPGHLRIAIARDEAFNFFYHENLQAFSRWGDVTAFSPLRDASVPEADLVYLAGGYPELHLDQLSANAPMRDSIRAYCERGGRVLAECGGLMYLGRQIVDAQGRGHPMAGFLGIETSMREARLSLGYREVADGARMYRGHEFHHSVLREIQPLASASRVTDARGREVGTKIYHKLNVWASYVHFYWGELDGPPFLGA